MPSQTKLDKALVLADRGFRVFPLEMNGKTPALEANWRRIATTDEAKIRRLWTCPVEDVPLDYNIGVALDANTLVVDVDVRDGRRGDKSLALLEAIYEPLPETYEVITASNGRHLYFRVPGIAGNFPAKLAEHVDLKGEGGYVVGPGSVLHGRSYQLAHQEDGHNGPNHTEPGAAHAACGTGIRPLPAWIRPLEEKLSKLRTNVTAPIAECDSPQAIERAIDYAKYHAPESVQGAGGDSVAYQVAARVKDLGVSEAVCLQILEDHWDERNAPPWGDELAAKVRNAYAYGKDPPGIAAPEAEFDAVDVDMPAALASAAGVTKRRGLFWKRFEEAAANSVAEELVEGWIDVGAMSVWYGKSNVGKTFVLLSIAHAIASGRPWNGRRVKLGLAVYVAAEGGHSIETRLMALRKTAGDARIAYVPCPVDLLHENADTKPLVRLIREIASAYGESPVLIVVDTLSRALAGGNENASDDMGALVKNLDAIRAAFGAHMAIVHHKGKNDAAGARGHSLLQAATDTEIEIAEGKITATKQRDKEAAKPVRFRLTDVEVGRRMDGSRLTSCVVEFLQVSEFEVKVTEGALGLYRCLKKLVMRKLKVPAAERDKYDNHEVGAPPEEWQLVEIRHEDLVRFYQKTRGGKGAGRTMVFEHISGLSGSNLIHKTREGSICWVG